MISRGLLKKFESFYHGHGSGGGRGSEDSNGMSWWCCDRLLCAVGVHGWKMMNSGEVKHYFDLIILNWGVDDLMFSIWANGICKLFFFIFYFWPKKGEIWSIYCGPNVWFLNPANLLSHLLIALEPHTMCLCWIMVLRT